MPTGSSDLGSGARCRLCLASRGVGRHPSARPRHDGHGRRARRRAEARPRRRLPMHRARRGARAIVQLAIRAIRRVHVRRWVSRHPDGGVAGLPGAPVAFCLYVTTGMIDRTPTTGGGRSRVSSNHERSSTSRAWACPRPCRRRPGQRSRPRLRGSRPGCTRTRGARREHVAVVPSPRRRWPLRARRGRGRLGTNCETSHATRLSPSAPIV